MNTELVGAALLFLALVLVVIFWIAWTQSDHENDKLRDMLQDLMAENAELRDRRRLNVRVLPPTPPVTTMSTQEAYDHLLVDFMGSIDGRKVAREGDRVFYYDPRKEQDNGNQQ